MGKALFKKQMMELGTWFTRDKKRGGRRTAGAIVGIALAFALLLVMVGALFFIVAVSLCEPLLSMGLGWLYFAMMDLIAVVLGVVGSVFNTYASLYLAKDNELLLSLPIPPRYILFTRLFGVWIWGAVYEALVFVPTLIVYWMQAGQSRVLTAGAVVCGILLFLLLSLFVLTLTCVLGWVVAQISLRLKHKNVVTVIASVAFIGLYYYIYFQAYQSLQNILLHAEAIGAAVQGWARPLYWLGRTGEGDLASTLLTAAIIAALLAATCLVLDRSFVKMATSRRGEARRKYREQAVKLRSPMGAMYSKEVGRFTSSAAYMLNCSMGSLFMLIAGVAALIFRDSLQELATAIPVIPAAPLSCAAVCSMASMNYITAPSVSLEGKSLWLAQSLPVEPWTALKAKLALHLAVTEIPVVFCGVCLVIALRLTILDGWYVLVLPVLYTLLCAAFGLAVNLKSPNLTWVDETVPLKQSMSITVCVLGGMAAVLIFAGIYYLLQGVAGVNLAMALCALLIAFLAALLLRWLKTNGSVIFSELSP